MNCPARVIARKGVREADSGWKDWESAYALFEQFSGSGWDAVIETRDGSGWAGEPAGAGARAVSGASAN